LGSYSWAYGINDLGQVVGASVTPTGDVHAFLWTAADGMIDLGTLGGNNSEARGINDLGQVVGVSETASLVSYHAFLWTAAGGMTDLDPLGEIYSAAYGISDLGQVVGVGQTASGFLRAFLWTATDGITDLDHVDGNNSEAWGINEVGQAVGLSEIPGDSGQYYALLWTLPAASPVTTEIIAEKAEALVTAGVLSEGQGTALTRRLEAAAQQLDKGKTATAINVLRSFINQVSAFLKAGILSPAEGQPLIDAAQAFINQLTG
jgi:probable HAF family extracellular repeat protein